MCDIRKSSAVKVRNHFCIPSIFEEGSFEKSLPYPKNIDYTKIWYTNLTPHERLFYHQTLNSTRRFAKFKPNGNIPKDSLDFILDAEYDHAREVFPENNDDFVQGESLDMPTFRRIRNSTDVSPPKIDALGHPLQIGGIKEKISPHSVKLMNSGHHTQLTNPGYSRQHSDGNFFYY